MDGGGWLTIKETPVDWIYRDLGRVQRSVEQSVAGQFAFHFQVGHPFGFPDFAYAGEVALGIVLADPTGELQRLKDRLRDYPAALGLGDSPPARRGPVLAGDPGQARAPRGHAHSSRAACSGW